MCHIDFENSWMSTLKPKPPWVLRYTIFKWCKLNLNNFFHLELYLMLCCKQSTLLRMLKIQVTRDWSSLNVNMPSDPNFLFIVLPFKWLKSDVKRMFQCKMAFFMDVTILSTTSMVSPNCSSIHVIFPLTKIKFIFIDFCLSCDTYWRCKFSWSKITRFDWFNNPLLLLQI